MNLQELKDIQQQTKQVNQYNKLGRKIKKEGNNVYQRLKRLKKTQLKLIDESDVIDENHEYLDDYDVQELYHLSQNTPIKDQRTRTHQKQKHQFSNPQKAATSSSRKSLQKIKDQGPILLSTQFKKVDEIDFNIFIHHLSRTKIYSVLLLNEYGKIIFADKLGSEHYEGSLNNFAKVSIQNLMLTNSRSAMVQQMRSISNFNETTILKYIIYSKNAKRRYSRIGFHIESSVEDVFYRFLKCLSCRIRPIDISFQRLQAFQGFWNKELATNGVSIRCYMLQTRLSKQLPKLKQLDLLHDCIIEKYIHSNKKKIARRIQEFNNEQIQNNIGDKQFCPQPKVTNSKLKKMASNIYRQSDEGVRSLKNMHMIENVKNMQQKEQGELCEQIYYCD